MAFARKEGQAKNKNAPRDAVRRSTVDEWIPKGSFEIIGSSPFAGKGASRTFSRSSRPASAASRTSREQSIESHASLRSLKPSDDPPIPIQPRVVPKPAPIAVRPAVDNDEEEDVQDEEVEDIRREVEAATVPSVAKAPSIDFSDPSEEEEEEDAEREGREEDVDGAKEEKVEKTAKNGGGSSDTKSEAKPKPQSAVPARPAAVLVDAEVQTPVVEKVARREEPMMYPLPPAASPFRSATVAMTNYNGQENLASSWATAEGQPPTSYMHSAASAYPSLPRPPPSSSLFQLASNPHFAGMSPSMLDTYNGQMEVPPSKRGREKWKDGGEGKREEGMVRLVHASEGEEAGGVHMDVQYGQPTYDVFNGQAEVLDGVEGENEEGGDIAAIVGGGPRLRSTIEKYRPIDWRDGDEEESEYSSEGEESYLAGSGEEEEDEREQREHEEEEEMEGEGEEGEEGEEEKQIGKERSSGESQPGTQYDRHDSGVALHSSLERGTLYAYPRGSTSAWSTPLQPVEQAPHSPAESERGRARHTADSAFVRKLVPFATAAFFIPPRDCLQVLSVCGTGTLVAECFSLDGVKVEEESGAVFSSDPTVATTSKWSFDGPLRVHFQSSPLHTQRDGAIPAEARNGSLEVTFEKRKGAGQRGEEREGRIKGGVSREEVDTKEEVKDEEGVITGDVTIPAEVEAKAKAKEKALSAEEKVQVLKAAPKSATSSLMKSKAATAVPMSKSGPRRLSATAAPQLGAAGTSAAGAGAGAAAGGKVAGAGNGTSMFGWKRVQGHPVKGNKPTAALAKLKSQLAESKVVAAQIKAKVKPMAAKKPV
uniref:Uncharacterized protein n=1 Tax=Palpitomonas bilix TaxID=652834 RepID=A0A7S3D1C4_9EUKA|mmetsp:Transcript_18238/g.45605  ORF Transcript_18238/g.45605 Transcript_18238/m.45605 type:complete len:822 (+) Transcript_18238:214-2679(+)